MKKTKQKVTCKDKKKEERQVVNNNNNKKGRKRKWQNESERQNGLSRWDFLSFSFLSSFLPKFEILHSSGSRCRPY